jgi:hypothetical protein
LDGGQSVAPIRWDCAFSLLGGARGGSPPAWQSALREYQERKPRRRPSNAIAIHESTDGPAILRRVFSAPIEPDKDDLRDEVA